MLRNLGCSLNNSDDIPDSVLNYISEQLSINPIELKHYAQRENTRREHLQEITDTYGYRNFIDGDYEYLLKLVLPAAMENGNAINLIKIAVSELRKQKIVLLGITTIERLVNQARIQANEAIIEMINKALTREQKLRMDMLINGKDEEAITSLGWLRSDIGYPSPKSFIEVIEKLE